MPTSIGWYFDKTEITLSLTMSQTIRCGIGEELDAVVANTCCRVQCAGDGDIRSVGGDAGYNGEVLVIIRAVVGVIGIISCNVIGA